MTKWDSYHSGKTKGGTGENKYYQGGLGMEPHVQHANTIQQYRSMASTNLRDKQNKKRSNNRKEPNAAHLALD